MTDYRISRGLFDDLASDVEASDLAAIQARLREAHVLMPEPAPTDAAVSDAFIRLQDQAREAIADYGEAMEQEAKKRKRWWPF